MSGFTSFDEQPSWSDAPPDCQFRGCDEAPVKYVRFHLPSEFVCYCSEHADTAQSRGGGESSQGDILAEIS